MVVDAARVVAASLVLVAIAGCTPARPPVYDRSPDYTRPNTYTVAAGDTLYSIAWRYELTVPALARANRLRPPYTIYPGQTLRLHGARGARPAPARPRAQTPAPSRPAPAASSIRWRWPTQAAASRPFGNGNKGMDFRLPTGARVVAAADGSVVYAGNGLGGYRHLVIIKHDQHYLSAYSLNVAGRVAEGQSVKAGAILADIPKEGRRAQTLHFEIRRDGEAINPKGVIRQ